MILFLALANLVLSPPAKVYWKAPQANQETSSTPAMIMPRFKKEDTAEPMSEKLFDLKLSGLLMVCPPGNWRLKYLIDEILV